MKSKWYGYIGILITALLVLQIWLNNDDVELFTSPETQQSMPLWEGTQPDLISLRPHLLNKDTITIESPSDVVIDVRMNTFTTELLKSKQSQLHRKQTIAAETMMMNNYHYFLQELYSDEAIRGYYVNLVPNYVLNALLSLRITLIAEGAERYRYIMPHTAAFQMLSDRLVEHYQNRYSDTEVVDSGELLLQAKRELTDAYGEDFSSVIHWFGIDKLPEYSDLLILTPVELGQSHDDTPVTHQLVSELFPEFKIEPERLKSVQSYPLDMGSVD
ncbi:hypothetical protein [Vibrio astriarenae]|uniref:hypothetical protein n=1 Tax=Vibrio astriarenae TaxID=1481923 RepID=UPI003735C1E9